MRRAFLFGVAVVVTALLVSACKKADPDADAAAIRDLVTEDTVHFKAGTAGDSTEGGFLLDDTTVGLWWRGPQTHDSQPTIDVEVVDDSAWVGWHQSNYGEFIHWVRTSDSTSVRWIKELTERVQLNAIFRREGDQTDTDRGWRLKRISLVSGVSDTANTVLIDSLRIQSSIRDIMIVDPLNTYYMLDSLVTFTPGEQLTLTLYTNMAEGRAFLHAFWGWLLLRHPFEHQGEGVHTGTWNAQVIPGFRFAIFDLITESTLLDPAAPYDYNGWLFPYKIQPAD